MKSRWTILLACLCIIGMIVSICLTGVSVHYHQKYRAYREKASRAEAMQPRVLSKHSLNVLDSIARKFDSPREGDFHAFIERVMIYVYGNSEHIIDAEHRQYAFKPDEVIERLWLASEGRGSKPHLTCGPRATVMKNILDHLAVESRKIHCFATQGEQVRSHTFVEVFNPETHKWECWDPDKKIYYPLEGEKSLAGVFDLMRRGSAVAAFKPKDSTWEASITDSMEDEFFSYFILEPRDGSIGIREGVVLYMSEEVDPDRVCSFGESFREWVYRNYGRLRFVPLEN